MLSRTTDSVVYAGTLYGEPVTIEQAFLPTSDDINTWLERVRLQYCVRADGVLPVYGALVNIDSGGVPTFYTVTQRAAGSLASMVLAADGMLARIDMTARLRLVWQAAGALAALHARGIVHGAVTPANVQLSSTDGVVAAVRVVGYNSAAGAGSAAGDVRDWGALTWSVLAGQLLEGGSPHMAVLTERGVPTVVVGVVHECLAADPEARPVMADVARTLAAALATHRTSTTTGAAGGGVSDGATTSPRSTELSASAAAARDAMLQLALKTTTYEDADRLCGDCGAVAATLHAFIVDVAVVRAACVVLCNLSKGQYTEGLIRDGLGAALVAAVRTHANDAEILRHASHSLSQVARSDRRGLLVLCDRVGRALVTALRSDAADMTVARMVYTTLQDLSIVSDNAVALQRDGCGAAVASTLHRFVGDAQVAADACGALQSLAAVEANRSDLARDGAGAAVVLALQRHAGDASVACSGCAALNNLAASPASREVLVHRDPAVAATLVAALQLHSGDVQVAQWAASALRSISHDAASCESLVHDHATVAAIVAVLQGHVNNVVVARAACDILRNLAAIGGSSELLARVDGIGSALVAALQRHFSDVTVVVDSCWALHNLAVGRAAALPHIGGTGAAVLAALRRHVASDADTVHAIVVALSDLAVYSSARAMLASEDVAALQRAAVLYPDHCELQLCCDDALTLLH